MQGSEDPFTMLTAASEKVHIRYGQVHLCVHPGAARYSQKFLLSNSKSQPGLVRYTQKYQATAGILRYYFKS